LAQETSKPNIYRGFANFKDVPTRVIREWAEDMATKEYHKILLTYLATQCNFAAAMTLKPETLVDKDGEGRNVSYYQGFHEGLLQTMKYLRTVKQELEKRREHGNESK
jgi:hypothetical protein